LLACPSEGEGVINRYCRYPLSPWYYEIASKESGCLKMAGPPDPREDRRKVKLEKIL
jgi:hypothetical protein